MENSRTGEICNVNFYRASMQKHLRSRNHLENVKQNDMFIPEGLFREEQNLLGKQNKKYIILNYQNN